MVRILAAAIAAWVAFGLATSARADDADAKRQAREHLAEGDRHLARGDELMERGRMERALEAYEAGLASYQAAHEAYPDDKIYFPIALAEQKLGRFLEALHHYELLLDERRQLSRAVVAQARKNIARVKKNLAALDLEVQPEGAAILVDGEEVGRAPLSGPHYMTPGKHTYAITLEGHTPVEGEVDIPPGKTEQRTIELEKVPVVVEAPPPGEAPEKTEQGDVDVVLWAGIGATVAFAAGATGSGLWAVQKHQRFEDESLSDSAREKARDKGKKWAVAADALWIATAAAATFTAYYYFELRDDGSAERADGDTAWWAPYAGQDGVGLALGGRF